MLVITYYYITLEPIQMLRLGAACGGTHVKSEESDKESPSAGASEVAS